MYGYLFTWLITEYSKFFYIAIAEWVFDIQFFLGYAWWWIDAIITIFIDTEQSTF